MAWSDSLLAPLGIPVAPTADPWETLADALAHSWDYALTDTWGTLTDYEPVLWTRLGWQDAAAKELGTPTEPLTYAPAADPWSTLDDALTALGFGYDLTDARPAIDDTLAVGFGYNLSDPWETLADTLGIGYGFIPPADALNLWADDRIISLTATLTVTPAADALNLWDDGAPTIDLLAALSFAATDPWQTLADAMAFGYGFAPVDPWETLADARAVFRTIAAAPSASDLHLWGDALAAEAPPVSETPIIVQLSDYWHVPPSPIVDVTDAWGTLADSLAIIAVLRVTPGEPTMLTWEWEQGSGGFADGFRVHRGVVSNTYTAYYQLANPAARSVDLRLAVPAGDWYVAVSAYSDAGGQSFSYSNEVFVSYAVYADSAFTSTAWFNITDTFPAVLDELAAFLTYAVTPAAEENVAYTDTVEPPIGHEANFAADANAAYTSELAAQLDEIVAFTDDALFLADAFGLGIGFIDARPPLVDALGVTYGSYVENQIPVFLLDNLAAYVDDILGALHHDCAPVADPAGALGDTLAHSRAYNLDDSFTWSDALGVVVTPHQLAIQLSDDANQYADALAGPGGTRLRFKERTIRRRT